MQQAAAKSTKCGNKWCYNQALALIWRAPTSLGQVMKTEYTGSFKSDCKEIPELLYLFFGLVVVVYSPITKLHDFFASLIRQLIDTGAL